MLIRASAWLSCWIQAPDSSSRIPEVSAVWYSTPHHSPVTRDLVQLRWGKKVKLTTTTKIIEKNDWLQWYRRLKICFPKVIKHKNSVFLETHQHLQHVNKLSSVRLILSSTDNEFPWSACYWPKSWGYSIVQMQIKTTMMYHLTPVRITIIKKSTDTRCWRQCGEKGTLLHYWWECKLVQPLWKTVWRFL